MPSPLTGFILAILWLTALGGLTWPADGLAAGEEAVARRLLNSQGCKACHPFEAQGEFPAPDLDRVGGRLGKEQLRRKLVSADHRHAGGRIADFSHLSSAEIDALVIFLEQRK